MNRAILSAPVSDSQGQIEFKFDVGNSELLSRERRITRRATLDGGSVFDDYGYSHSDRDFTLVTYMSGEMIEALNYMVETFSSILVSTVEGFFLGTFQDTRVKGNEVTIKILIMEKLA
jgi:hypothetical protein